MVKQYSLSIRRVRCRGLFLPFLNVRAIVANIHEVDHSADGRSVEFFHFDALVDGFLASISGKKLGIDYGLAPLRMAPTVKGGLT